MRARGRWRMEGREAVLRVMSYNLRYAGGSGPAWEVRRPVARELLRRAAPHLLGSQEGLYRQVRQIAADLGPGYDWIGTGRDGGTRGEFTAVFYNAARLEPLEHHHFWLSDTPEVAGSNTWGGASVRMATWVRFLDRHTGARFHLANTHLDDKSPYARRMGAALLASRLAALDPELPRIVKGDFNVPAGDLGEPVYTTLVNGAGMVDAWTAAERRGPGYGTYTGYAPPVVGGPRIDWILVSRDIRVTAARIDDYSEDGQYPSDHLPVEATLVIPARAT